MNLTLPADHPLAQMIVSKHAIDSWLVLKVPASGPFQAYETAWRAAVTEWSLKRDHPDTLHVTLESWEDHLERKARASGL